VRAEGHKEVSPGVVPPLETQPPMVRKEAKEYRKGVARGRYKGIGERTGERLAARIGQLSNNRKVF